MYGLRDDDGVFVMSQPTMTYALAMACGRDAGNASMTAAGRTAWNRDDFRVALDEFHRLWPRFRIVYGIILSFN